MNNIDFHGIEEIWSSLSTSSLLWLTVTLAAYLFAQKLYKWSNWNSLPESGGRFHRHGRHFADGHAYAVSDLLFGRPVHSLPARTDHSSIGCTALRPQNSAG